MADSGIFAADLFAGRVVLVTGAAGGVGGAVASLLGGLGASLVLTDRDRDTLAPWAERGAQVVAADLMRAAGACFEAGSGLAAAGG